MEAGLEYHFQSQGSYIKVDDSFEKILERYMTKGMTFKDTSIAARCCLLQPKPKENPSSVPFPHDNHRLSDKSMNFLSDPPYLTKAVEAGKERFSEGDDVIGKARYTKAREAIEANLSTTTSH
ncbi:hypothetical protein FRB91_012021 [Serendipita sp. 411]|nr:hypothetical protein FRB91_012021 [Serendipita sp. 411]